MVSYRVLNDTFFIPDYRVHVEAAEPIIYEARASTVQFCKLISYIFIFAMLEMTKLMTHDNGMFYLILVQRVSKHPALLLLQLWRVNNQKIPVKIVI